MTFAEKFDRLRRRRGATIRDVASAAKVGVGTAGGWARESRPRPEVALRLASYLGVSVEMLLDDAMELPEVAHDRLRAAQAAGATAFPDNAPAAQERAMSVNLEERLRTRCLATADFLERQAKVLRAQSTHVDTQAAELEREAARLRDLPPIAATTPRADLLARTQANYPDRAKKKRKSA